MFWDQVSLNARWAWSTLCRAGWPVTQRPCGIVGIYHHSKPTTSVKSEAGRCFLRLSPEGLYIDFSLRLCTNLTAANRSSVQLLENVHFISARNVCSCEITYHNVYVVWPCFVFFLCHLSWLSVQCSLPCALTTMPSHHALLLNNIKFICVLYIELYIHCRLNNWQSIYCSDSSVSQFVPLTLNGALILHFSSCQYVRMSLIVM